MQPIPLTPAATARSGGTPDPSARLQQLRICKTPEDVPTHRRVLTDISGPLALSERDRAVMALVEVGQGEPSKQAILLWVNRLAHREQKIDLESRARQSGWKILETVEADPSVLQFLYAPESARSRHVEITDQRTKMDDEIDAIIGQALMMDASDIHLRILADRGVIFFRIHGDLHQVSVLHRERADLLSNALYTAADPDSKQTTFNPKAYQDAAVTRTVKRPDGVVSELKLRFASLPVYPSGWDIVLRLLPLGAGGTVRTLEELGYDAGQRAAIVRMLSRPMGAIALAGTTGSGKSTTLQSMVSMYYEANEGTKLPRTIEDPVEYPIVGARQTPVVRSTDGENPFAKALKACMRADPDAILVGEIRDEMTARLFQQAVQTGHKAFTTVHAGNPFDAIERLVDLGVKRTVITADEFVSGVIFQRLLPVLCDGCKVRLVDHRDWIPAPMFERLVLALDTHTGGRAQDDIARVYVRGPGCDQCRGRTTSGRTVAAQILLLDRELQHFILQEQLVLAKAYWRAAIGITELPSEIAPILGTSALDQGIEKMLAGRISPVDVEKELGQLNDQPTRHREREFYEAHVTRRVNR